MSSSTHSMRVKIDVEYHLAQHQVTPHGGRKQCVIQVTACVLEERKQRYSSKFKHSLVTLALQIVMILVTIIEAMNTQHAPGQNLPSCRVCFFSSLFALVASSASHDSARADNKPTTDTSDCYYKVRNCIWQFLNKCIQYS